MKNNYTLDELCPVDYIDPAAIADKTPKRVVFFDRDGTLYRVAPGETLTGLLV